MDFNIHMGNLDLRNHEEYEVPSRGQQLEEVA